MGMTASKNKIVVKCRGGNADESKEGLIDILVNNYDTTNESYGSLTDEQKAKISEAIGEDLVEAFNASKNSVESQLELIEDYETRYE